VLCCNQVGFSELEEGDQLRQTPFIQLADRRLSVGLDPFRMLNTQIMMDLLLQLSIRAELAG